jgi:transposase
MRNFRLWLRRRPRRAVGVAQTGGLSEWLKTILGMPQNFLECDREQVFLMPRDPRDWLGEGHLAWFVLASVEEMDLSAFYGSYRQDGWGRAAFEPQMMVALLLYAYARGERSWRGIERRCVEDVAYRVIAAQQTPDHATIARFRVRHEVALAGLFSEVLGLCRESGLVQVGLIAIDGTKVMRTRRITATSTTSSSLGVRPEEVVQLV